MQLDRLVDEALPEQRWQMIRFWHQEIKKDPAECVLEGVNLHEWRPLSPLPLSCGPLKP
jgi:very-short-patch-repair endonuclease